MDTSQWVFYVYTIAITCVLLSIPVVIMLYTMRAVKKAGRTLFTTRRRLARK